MPFITQGKTNWKFLLIVIVLATIVGSGALWYSLKKEVSYQPPKGGKPQTSKEFNLGLDEEAKIIYEFETGTGVKREEFTLSLKKIDLSSKKVTFLKYCFLEPEMSIGGQSCCAVTEEGGSHFKLIKLEENKATFETWFGIGEPHPLGPFLPKEIIITKSTEKMGCDWRPTKDLGLCAAVQGFYYDGEKCVAISGCGRDEEAIPFQTIEECKVLCEETADWKTYRNEKIGIELKYSEKIFGNPYVAWEKTGGIGIIFSKEKYNPKQYTLFFDAYGSDYKIIPPGFGIFTGAVDIASYCPEPLKVKFSGGGWKMCKIIQIAGQKAIFETFFTTYEGMADFNVFIYFNNQDDSPYKGLIFYLADLEEIRQEIIKFIPDDYMTVEWDKQKFESNFYTQSMNIMENKNLSEKYKEKLEAFNQMLSTFKFIETSALTSSIDSISPNLGPIGTTIEIRGKNFSGFEGDLNAWIENSNGVKGVIYGESGSSKNLIKFTLKSSYCQQDNSYSGLPCTAFLDIISGVYKIYITPWGQKSNIVSFTVTPLIR